jgi:hypothetical protein
MNFTCHLKHLPTVSILSLNRFIYILKQTTEKGQYHIEAFQEREGTVHFEVTQKYVLVSDEATKLVSFCSLQDLISTNKFTQIHTQ